MRTCAYKVEGVEKLFIRHARSRWMAINKSKSFTREFP